MSGVYEHFHLPNLFYVRCWLFSFHIIVSSSASSRFFLPSTHLFLIFNIIVVCFVDSIVESKIFMKIHSLSCFSWSILWQTNFRFWFCCYFDFSGCLEYKLVSIYYIFPFPMHKPKSTIYHATQWENKVFLQEKGWFNAGKTKKLLINEN